MEKKFGQSTLKRLQNRYRLVIMNDDTYEEVGAFKLSRLSVYIVLSTIFVLLISITVAVIVFTPIKYYIPGYSNGSNSIEYRNMKVRIDSMEREMRLQVKYMDNIKNILEGTTAKVLDTTQLTVPTLEISDD